MPVKLEKEGAVGIIVLDRPPANSYDYAFLAPVQAPSTMQVPTPASKLCSVTSASEKFFSAGADVSAFAAGSSVRGR